MRARVLCSQKSAQRPTVPKVSAGQTGACTKERQSSRHVAATAAILMFVIATKSCHIANHHGTSPNTNPSSSRRVSNPCETRAKPNVRHRPRPRSQLAQLSQCSLGFASGQARSLLPLATTQVCLCPPDASAMTRDTPRPRRRQNIVFCDGHQPLCSWHLDCS